jgi:hypothetical protein
MVSHLHLSHILYKIKQARRKKTMKKVMVSVTVGLLAISGLVVSCGVVVTGSGDLVTESYDYTDFTGIQAQNGFEVEIVRSDSFSVKVTTDDNIKKYLDVEKIGDTLRIRLDQYRNYVSVTIEAKITMPDIEEIRLSGGSHCEITGFSSSNDLSATLSGGSQLEGDINAGDTEIELSGGSRATLTGSAKDLTIKSSGGSKVLLEDFPVNNADINISGGGSAEVDISGTMDANLSGGSKIRYIGEPKIGDFDLSGGSTISKK